MKTEDGPAWDWSKILRYVPKGERERVQKTLLLHYSQALLTDHPVVEVDGVLRFRTSPMVRWLVDNALSGKNGGPTLNEMAVAAQAGYGGRWSVAKVQQFYRDMGYSLGGFLEINWDSWKTRRR